MRPETAVRAQITAGPSDSAPLLLDLNDDPLYVLHDGFTLGAAQGDERRVELTVRGRGQGAIVPRAMSELMRAINQPQAWFLWQADSSHKPEWFRILDSVTEMDFRDTTTADPTLDPVYTLQVSLLVESDGYGERVTLEPITVTNAALGVALPQIEGDAPTFARIDVRALGDQSWGTWRSLLNITPVLPSCPLGAPGAPGEVVSNPLPPVITWEAEAFTLAAGSGNVTGSGLSGNAGVSFDETDGTWRLILSGSVPVKPPPGTYQVLARLSRSSTAGGCRLRVGHFGWDQPLDNRAPVWQPPSGSSQISWLTLGELSFPAGQPLEGLTSGDMNTPNIRLYGRGLALGGASNKIVVDRFALVPVRLAEGGEGITLMSTWGTAGPLGDIPGGGLWNSWRLDGDQRRNGLVAFDGPAWHASATPPLPAGGFPVLHPGMRNLLTLVPHTSYKGSGSDAIGTSCQVTVSYHPRIRHIAS